MVLLIKSGGPKVIGDWQAVFAEFAPDLVVREWNDPTVDPHSVRYVLVWEPEAGRCALYPGLRMVLSAAAGVDHSLADPDLPAHLPIVRMVTTETAERMADFVSMSALALIRDLPRILDAQRQHRWAPLLTGRLASETRVGILGLGQLGTFTAKRLAAIGFQVTGWSRSAKTLDGIACLAGDAGLDTLLAQSQILVNLLPDTPETRGIIGADTLARLPRGAGLVNVGRGSHLDRAALLAALDSGHIDAAVLDVFDSEPLPPEDPLWDHPAVIVTPHIASHVSRRARARQAALTIAADLRGEPPAHLYDRVRGY